MDVKASNEKLIQEVKEAIEGLKKVLAILESPKMEKQKDLDAKP